MQYACLHLAACEMLPYHNLSVEDATKLALAGHSGGYWHWISASQTLTTMTITGH